MNKLIRGSRVFRATNYAFVAIYPITLSKTSHVGIAVIKKCKRALKVNNTL